MTCIQIGLVATGAYAHSTPEPGFATAKTNVERMNITNSKVNNAEAPYRRVTFQARTAKFNRGWTRNEVAKVRKLLEGTVRWKLAERRKGLDNVRHELLGYVY